MNNEWIEWTWAEEKPYPETLETKVYVRFGDGVEATKRATQVSCYYTNGFGSNFEPDDYPELTITHYKLA